MKLINRYLWRAVMMPSLGVLGILVSLDCLFGFIRELEFLRGDYQTLEALQFVLTSSPRRVYEFLPMGILLGTLMGLGLLANSGELTVIRAAGVSTGRISWMVLRPALLLLVIGLVIGEYIAPYTEQVAQSNRSIAEGGGEALRSKYGYWHREGNEFIHINAVQPNGVLYGVTRYRFDEQHRLVESQYIERAIHQAQADYWFLENVKGSRLYRDHVETYRQPTGLWRTDLTPQLLSLVILEPKYLALSKLLDYARYLKDQGLQASEYMLSFWQKMLRPLATIGMVLIAISFIFGPMREVSMGLRLTAGIVAGLLFHYGQEFFGHLSLVFDTSPLAAAAVPPLLCIIVGVEMLRRVK